MHHLSERDEQAAKVKPPEAGHETAKMERSVAHLQLTNVKCANGRRHFADNLLKTTLMPKDLQIQLHSGTAARRAKTRDTVKQFKCQLYMRNGKSFKENISKPTFKKLPNERDTQIGLTVAIVKGMPPM